MILFYSDYCQHCSILIDTIKRYDKKKSIKIVSIDLMKKMNKPINEKIHSVPALLFLPSKELIFGKEVFDYLLLPNRGYLFNNNSTRTDKTDNSSINAPIPLNIIENPEEPNPFTLGRISSDNFSDISVDDNNSSILSNDKVYNWTLINNKNDDNSSLNNIKIDNDNNKLSIDELIKLREEQVK